MIETNTCKSKFWLFAFNKPTIQLIDVNNNNNIINNNTVLMFIMLFWYLTCVSLWEFTQFTWRMQTQWQVATNPQTKPSDLDCEPACIGQLPSTFTATIYYYYSAQKLILILPSRGRWKAEST